jgi:hypothetical protein
MLGGGVMTQRRQVWKTAILAILGVHEEFIMQRITLYSVMCMIVLFVLGEPHPARATLLTGLESAVVLQGVIPDSDYVLMAALAGFGVGEALNYTATLDAETQRWTASFTGTYLGNQVNIAYQGAFSAFPSGPLTWTTTGTFGTAMWKGGGSAAFADTAMGFDITFNNSAMIGAETGTYAERVISAEGSNGDLNAGVEFVSTTVKPGQKDMGSIFDRLGTGLLDAILKSQITFGISWGPSFPVLFQDDVEPLQPGLNISSKGRASPPRRWDQHSMVELEGTVEAVPEPSSLALLATGCVGLFALGCRRCRWRA